MNTLLVLVGLGTLTNAAPFYGQLVERDANNSNISYTTAHEQIQCYALPYGGIGCASHALTFYTLACLGCAARPLIPWSMTKHGKLDEALAVVSLAGSCGLAIYTAVSCHREWQYLLVALWKLSMSMTLGCTSLHRAIDLRKEKKAGNELSASTSPINWGFITVPGLILGLTGLISLVLHFWHDPNPRLRSDLRIINLAFGAAVVVFALLHFFGLFKRVMHGTMHLLGYINPKDDMVPNDFLILTYWLGFLGAFYSDWILGAIAGDLVGIPSGDITLLYWSYFAAKRLPIFFQ